MKINISNYLDGKAREIIRCVMVGMVFLACVNLQGMKDLRQAHQIIFMLCMISLFSLLLKNIWVTLFVLWTVFLYSFFKFTTGSMYLSNVFLGSCLYLITKVAFDKKNINLYINAILWFVCANIFYMAIQVSGYDFIYDALQKVSGGEMKQTLNIVPVGFMGHKFALGTLFALSIPLLATRNSKVSWVGAFGLFIPLVVIKTSLCFLMGAVGMGFVLYFFMNRKLFDLMLIVLLIFGVFYVKKVDRMGDERLVQWHKTLKDAMIHPVTGWGLDSYANITEEKIFKYAQTVQQHNIYLGPPEEIGKNQDYEKRVWIEWWDNPHNLYLSLLYEWGFVGLFLFCGYIRQQVLRFKVAVKDFNTIALAGFILVFLGISMGHFPIFLARMAIFIVPAFALYEVSVDNA